MIILKFSLVLMACSLVSVVSFAQNISNAAFGEVGSYLRQLLDFRKSEVSSLADANRLLLECTDSSNELKETLIKATLPGFFVREAATPKFASS